MKLSQLMLAGDYLSYKGDWATNTAYNVNECVTWTDGHLYQVIKAHTSSSTIGPSNTEYYKAMTARKFSKIEGTIGANGIFSVNLYDILSKQSTKWAILSIALSGRSVLLDFTLHDSHDPTVKEYYIMAPNVLSIGTHDALLYFGDLIATESDTKLRNKSVIKWQQKSDNTIEASTISVSDSFALYYEQ